MKPVIRRLVGTTLAWAFVTIGLVEAAPVSAAAGAEPAIEEIIVTSRRRAESLQEVPISVSAFNEADLERIAPRSLRDLDGLLPNVFIGMNTAGPSAGAVFIRGIGYADIEKTQTPNVGVVIDGVFQGSSTGQLIDTFDVEQIEVNRGPQGVLYGRNTTGGTIVVTRRKPQFNEFGFKAQGQYGNFDRQEFQGRLNIPLIDDQLALKISGVNRQRDGFYDNVTQGCDECAGDIDYTAMTAALRWEPTASFSALLTYDYIDDQSDIPPQDPRYNGDDPFVNEANMDQEFQELKADQFGLQLEWDLGWGTLNSITGYQDNTDNVLQDFDGSNRGATASPLVQLHTLREQNVEQFTQELRLTGDLFGNQNLQYMVGGFYFDSELDFGQGTNQVVQLPAVALGLGPGDGCPLPPFPTPNPAVGDVFCQSPISYAAQRASQTEESLSYFASLTWTPTPNLEIMGGMRYIDEQKSFSSQFGTGAPNDPLLPPTQFVDPPFAGFPISDTDSWDELILESSVSYRISEQTLVYARYAEGFRSGGYSIRGTDPSRLTFDPENGTSYEIGAKNDFLDGALRLNVALFHIEIDDPQQSAILTTAAPPGTNTLILNRNQSEVRGAEFEVTWDATDNLSLVGSLGIQDATQKSDTQSSLDIPFNGNGFGCNPTDNPEFFPGDGSNSCPLVSFAEEDLTRAPDSNWALTGVWSSQLGRNRLDANVTYRGQDDTVLSNSLLGEPQIEDGWALLEARVSMTFPVGERDRLTVALQGKNLTDEEYREQVLLLGADGGFQGWAPPRTWALEVLWER